jgi:hypothetical protein
MMNLHWELSVLTRAVAYGNLSGAALHVGLSQPQLSRIVSRIEGELGVTLLDRAARRKSGWTPTAFKLAEVYSKSSRGLESDILKLVKSAEPASLKAATLEGLAGLASTYCRKLFDLESVRVVELDVHDLNRLEELFLGGELDLIFSSHLPGRKKFKNCREVGFQALQREGKESDMRVLSTFEYGTRHADENAKLLVSNSLEIRRAWIRKFGGHGAIPTEVRKKAEKGDHSVWMIGTDSLSAGLWSALVGSG